MNHEDPDKIRLGVFVARLFDDKEYGGAEEEYMGKNKKQRLKELP